MMTNHFRSTFRPLRTSIAALTALALAAGCAQLNTDQLRGAILPTNTDEANKAGIDPLWYIVATGALGLVDQFTEEPLEDVTLTQEQARAFPYAAQYVQFEGKPRLMTVMSFAERTGSSPIAVRVQWLTIANESIEQDATQRVMAIENIFGGARSVHYAGDNSAVRCFAEAARTATSSNHCPQQGFWAIDSKHQLQPVNPYAPRYIDQRVEAQVNYNLTSTNTRIELPDGRSVNAWLVQEQAQNGLFSNEFYIDPSSGKTVKSRQWLGDEFGYVTLEQVRDWATPAPQAPYAEADAVTMTVRSNQPPAEVKIAPRARMVQVIEALPQAGVESYFAPLLRLHSCDLDQAFEARKQGMLVRFKLLQQTYRAEGNEKLVQQAEALERAFRSWPLRATHTHGFSLADARFDLAKNPRVPAVSNCSPAPLSLSVAPAQPTQPVGLSPSEARGQAWVIQADGSISTVPLAAYEQTPSHRAQLQQPNSLVLYSIADSELPNGFRDLNHQLSLFLQHWDFIDAQ